MKTVFDLLSLIIYPVDSFRGGTMVKTKKNRRGLAESVAKKKGGVVKLNPFDVRTGIPIYLYFVACL